ncbi:MAG: hypothetical protein QXW10_03590 [Candidatus Micrarchaeaceae archaeon]
MHAGAFTILLIALIVVLVAMIVYSSTSSAPVRSISSLQLSFKPDTTFSFDGAYYLAYVHSVSGKGSAVIYLERQPILLNPILEINVSDTAITFVSPTLGSIASMEIKLLSATNSSATISISYVSPSLSIPTSSSEIRVVQHASIPAPTSNSSSNKPSNASTNTTSLPSTTTTTISSVNTTNETIMRIADSYGLFSTLQDYISAYSNLTKCTPALYNATYLSYLGSYPSGPSTYYNSSSISPHSMAYSIKGVNSTTYSLVFDTVSDFPATTGTAAIIYINPSLGKVTGYTLEGAYSGQTASSMQSNYINYTKVGGYCSILV